MRYATILSLVAFLSMANAVAAQGPRIECSAKGWDFGIKDQGQKDKTVLTITNKGDATLNITNIEVTCGCVVPEMSSKVIAPGASAELVLNLDAARGLMQIEKQVIIDSNDRQTPRLKLDIRGFIRPVWWTVEGDIKLPEISNGAEHERSFRINVNPDYVVNLVEVQAHPTDIKVRAEPYADPNGMKGWDIVLTFPKGMEAGYFEGIIIVKSDFAPFPMIGRRVFCDIVGSVTVKPESLAFGAVAVGQTKELTVRVKKEIGDGASIAAFSSLDDRIKLLRTNEVEKGKIFDLVIGLTPKPGDKDLLGRFGITVDQPGQQSFEVNWSARVK